MVRHKSAIRQHKRSLRRKAVNQSNTSALRTQIRKLREAIQAKDKDKARALLPKTFSTIDMAVKKKTIKPNTGSRTKSRLSRQVGLLTASPGK
ncbi:MAG: 30S ribosomal protein S20 [Candidatus Aminicenantes bacterium]|jgi:small subunit ribosomal protein S20|nr:30S ribosomal protein S20 [Candidatus Aminicenantes bacterium]